jgi:hypothetical protein
MNEAQEKPKKKWYRKWYTVALSLFLFCVSAYFLAMDIKPEIHDSPENMYNITKHNVKSAVQAYQDKHEGRMPTINGTVIINGSPCRIIDICALSASESSKLNLLYKATDSCISINGSDNDNCDASCAGCRETSSYIWVIDNDGAVCSTCAGKGCSTSNSGYQGVWP